MEIASTSRALHLFPTSEQRFKIKRGLGFSEISSTQSCRVRKQEEERSHHVLPAPKKRNKLSEEEEAANKRQKRTTEQDLTTTKVCSVSESPKDCFFLNSGKRSRSKPITALKSITLPRIRLHQETKTENKPKKVIITKPTDEEVSSLRDLIAKAKSKVEEKRKIDCRREYLARKRLLARLAINQIVPTVDFDDHLKYHHELLQLGCTFIQDQVNCLTKFSLLSRDSYYIEESTTSAASEEETKLLLASDGEIRKHGSAESTNRIK